VKKKVESTTPPTSFEKSDSKLSAASLSEIAGRRVNTARDEALYGQ